MNSDHDYSIPAGWTLARMYMRDLPGDEREGTMDHDYDYDLPAPMDWDADPDPHGDLADARRDAAEDIFRANAVKCADCGALWDPGWHPATRTSPQEVDRDECPRCGCGDTIGQDEQSLTEQIRDPIVEALVRWGKDRAAVRLAEMDPEYVYAAHFGKLLEAIWRDAES